MKGKFSILTILLSLHSVLLHAEDIVQETPKAEPVKETKERYQSPEIGNLSTEYMRSLQITSKQKKALAQDRDLWFADRFRVGFGIRPKADSIGNLDFDKSTADNRNNVVNQTQFIVLGDISPNLLFKLSLQDVRMWGGEVTGSGASDQKYAVISNAGTVYDTTRQREVPVNNYTGFGKPS